MKKEEKDGEREKKIKDERKRKDKRKEGMKKGKEKMNKKGEIYQRARMNGRGARKKNENN